MITRSEGPAAAAMQTPVAAADPAGLAPLDAGSLERMLNALYHDAGPPLAAPAVPGGLAAPPGSSAVAEAPSAMPGAPGMSGAPLAMAGAPAMPGTPLAMPGAPVMPGAPPAMPAAPPPMSGAAPALPGAPLGMPGSSLPAAQPAGAVPALAGPPMPGFAGHGPGFAAPDGLPVTADVPPFSIPKEIDLLPEPRSLHKQAGSPTPPEGIEHDTELTKPYWLAARETGIAAEGALQPLQILPIDADLEPTRIVSNLPAPPKRPPPQPPSKDWIVGKLVDMSGQDFARDSGPATTPTGRDMYWLPSPSGIRHGEHGTPAVPAQPGHFDVDTVRRDFPILKQKVNGKPLVWLDNAATTQKPQQVIDRISRYYETENSNVHRAAHDLAARATDAYEAARQKVRKFLGASTAEEIVFTRGATESINLVAQSYGGQHLAEGDEIILTGMEHHSNIVPWQHIARATGARIRVAPFFDSGEIDLGAYERLFNRRTRIVSVTHVSNALGSVLPVAEMIATAHRHGVVVLVDGAQSVPHFPVNVQALDADFYVLSSHKLFGPTGVGVLFGKKQLLEEMPPWQGGGNMIENVSFERTTYNPPPSKFEAGTAILAGAVGLGAAIDYLERIGFANAARYEHGLLEYGQEQLRRLKGVKLIGEAREKAGVMSFISDRVTPAEMGEILNSEGIAVRTGHHCAQPALAHYGLQATIRPSLAFYNTRDEVDLLVATVRRAIESRG